MQRVMTKLRDGGGIYVNGWTNPSYRNTMSHNWCDADEAVFAIFTKLEQELPKCIACAAISFWDHLKILNTWHSYAPFKIINVSACLYKSKLNIITSIPLGRVVYVDSVFLVFVSILHERIH